MSPNLDLKCLKSSFCPPFFPSFFLFHSFFYLFSFTTYCSKINGSQSKVWAPKWTVFSPITVYLINKRCQLSVSGQMSSVYCLTCKILAWLPSVYISVNPLCISNTAKDSSLLINSTDGANNWEGYKHFCEALFSIPRPSSGLIFKHF